jgi:hypothetical protein
MNNSDIIYASMGLTLKLTKVEILRRSVIFRRLHPPFTYCTP